MYDIVFISYNEPNANKNWEILKTRFPFAKRVSGANGVDKAHIEAAKKCFTKMFWVVYSDLEVHYDFDFSYVPDKWSQDTIHVFRNGDFFDGISLIPKENLPTEKEFQHRFYTNKKEVDILASTPRPYDLFYVNSYEECQKAIEESTTEMFWAVPSDIEVSADFNFDYRIPYYDSFHKNITHVFLNGEHYDGVCLISKNSFPTKKEFDHRFFVHKKEVDIQASTPRSYDVFEIETYEQYQSALENSSTEMFWMSSPNISINQELVNTFYFSHHNTQDRSKNHAFIHEVDGENFYNGLFLCSKKHPLTKREVEYRFPINRREWNLIGSTSKPYDVFEIETYEQYQSALENSSTEMFWMSSPNISLNEKLVNTFYFPHHNEYDRFQNHAFIHEVDGENFYNGLFLCSKTQPFSKNEVEYRFPVNRKEWDLIGSTSKPYDVFEIETYEQYQYALENATTEMFWVIPNDVDRADSFKFDWYFTHDNSYDRNNNHSLLNGKYNDGIVLFSKTAKISQKEFDYGFIINKKEHNILASNPKPFDIVFISYNEPNAEHNFQKLKNLFSNVKRVHGVEGIHNAHIEAAKQVGTNMFWVVDGDAEIMNNFNFDYQVPRWDQGAVHVWRSKNPVNSLIYGYGGVKLLPTNLTLNMDTHNPDMTTSISNKFKAVPEISNITQFNTDSFNAWKSGFRECAKLASGIIDRQKDQETQTRLDTWCNQGVNRPFGIDAIKGAKEGRHFGEENKNNTDELQKINDFGWLYERFSTNSI